MWADIDYSGKTCPLPGSLPHGNWSCETQEIPIHGTSFLDEDAQSYPGQLVYFWKTSRFLDFQFKINPQLFNAGWRVSLAMSLSGLLWSPVWTGIMQKSVIICQIHSWSISYFCCQVYCPISLPLLVGYNSLWIKQLSNQSYNKT